MKNCIEWESFLWNYFCFHDWLIKFISRFGKNKLIMTLSLLCFHHRLDLFNLDGISIRRERVIREKGYLKLLDLEPNDEAIYVCTASSSMYDPVHVTGQVTVKSKLQDNVYMCFISISISTWLFALSVFQSFLFIAYSS